MSENRSLAEIKIKDGIMVTVPNSLTLMTPYILYEQNDWFEDEIKFIREFIKPGMHALDIGANYGLYTLAIANIVGDKGKVWAFEPTASTFSCLENSVHENAFTNVELFQLGLSNRTGSAQFFTGQNAELNSLSQESLPSGNAETIELTTLDHCLDRCGWTDLDFIKLDAEGEEVNILNAAEKLLSTLSPLIMFELKHGASVNIALVSKFRSLGYDTYRLIPGMNVLVPFDENQEFDKYLLNLFCCKSDKAIALEQSGVIVRSWDEKVLIDTNTIAEYSRSEKLCLGIKALFENAGEIVDSQYLQVLSAYIASISPNYTLKERLSYLMYALEGSKSLLDKGVDDVGQLSTFSRIAFDAGERVLGVNILNSLIHKYPDELSFELSSPFMIADKEYDSASHISLHNTKLKEWVFSSIVEKFIEKHAFSTYFVGKKIEAQFVRLQELGFMSDLMKKRYNLLQKVFIP